MTVRLPVLLVGCGRLGSAMTAGWSASGAFPLSDLMIRTPSIKPAAEAARAAGAVVNPTDAQIGSAKTVVLAVKPAAWRGVAEEVAPTLAPDAIIVSVMAGVRAADISKAFGGRAVARAMPTTGVANLRGSAAVWAADAVALDAATSLFDPVADVVPLGSEALLDAATAISGSAPAYFFEMAQALARAGVEAGLEPAAAARLARGALRSAGSGVEGDRSLEVLTAEVASPGGTTQAALDRLRDGGALDRLIAQVVQAAIARAVELGGG